MALDIIIITAALVTAVLLLKKRANIGIIMIVESVFLIIPADLKVSDYLMTVYNSVRSQSTLRLIIVFIFIMILENILRKSGMMKDISSSLKEIIGNNRMAAGILPVVVGLLPSPGGARFSCPMVEEAASGNSADGDLAFVNYWFRHIWMDGFILYPGIILTAELIGVSVISFFIKLLPFIFVTAATGYFTGLRKIRKVKTVGVNNRKHNLKLFLISLSPVLIVIILYMILIGITDLALEISLVSVSVSLFIIKKYTLKDIWKAIKESFPFKLILIIFGVMIFKDVLFETGLLDGLPAFLDKSGIPVYAAFLILPFAAGVSTGITVSFISMSFPILLTLGLAGNIWYSVLAFTAGYIGMMITPVHLCMVVTGEYFRNPLHKLMKKVMISEIPLALLIIVLMILLFRR
jgi:uncharacterized protein